MISHFLDDSRLTSEMSLEPSSVAFKMKSDTGPGGYFCTAIILHSKFNVLSCSLSCQQHLHVLTSVGYLVGVSLALPLRTDCL